MKDIRQKIENEMRVLISEDLIDLIREYAEKAFQAGEENIDYETAQENGEWIVRKTYKTNRNQWIKENLK